MTNDNTIRPSHYKQGIEVYKFINSHNLNFNIGNVVKYVCRANYKHKSPMEDLLKAKQYIDFEIERINENGKEGNKEND